MARKATRVTMAASACCLVVGRRSIHEALASYSSMSPPAATLMLSALCMLLGFMAVADMLRTPLVFAWNCFFKPLTKCGGTDNQQQGRLNAFYSGQAEIYDTTRSHLLKGRETMLQLMAAHLKAQPDSSRGGKPKVWVDIGGGTGWNIEKMDEYLPLTYFDKIYLVDLCEPLLNVARQRFQAKGFKNVHVLCQDASRFVLPEWESGELDPRGSITAITLSYSLSMIPAFYQLLDRCDQVLDPKRGLMGVVDFYTSRDAGIKERAIGTQSKRMSWFAKWFWECWFEMDNVHLHGSRREYLEYKMGTIKTYNARNNFLNTYLVSIPYYIFLGCSRRRDATLAAKAFEVEAGNKIGMGQGGLLTPVSPFASTTSPAMSPMITPGFTAGPDFFSLGPSAMDSGKEGYQQTIEDTGAPLSPFHYQLRKNWRVPYMEEKIHESFRTHIYGWTWEDPDVDIKKLNLGPEDKVLCITSAGDVCLSYALNAKCKAIHAVDMNPCQGHILELKLAAIQALEYQDFWLIFGEGCHPQFAKLLTTKLSPFLSSHAFAYWMTHADQFSRNFYFRGYSGWALRLAQVAFTLAGVRGSVKRLCSAQSVEEQKRIWETKLRPILLNRIMVKGFLGNPFFNWHALGVPRNQMNCFLADGTIEDFIAATLDPIPGLSRLKDDNYFYLLCLNGRYTRASCPAYLKPEGFHALKTSKQTQAFKLHTDTILNVLRGLPDGSLTTVIVMDSMDWFDPIPASTPLPTSTLTTEEAKQQSPEAALESLRSELDYEILEMRRVLAVGGHAVWRSAGKYPWYRQRFELAGFKVEPIDIRENGQAIDRVNMYASFWRAEKV